MNAERVLYRDSLARARDLITAVRPYRTLSAAVMVGAAVLATAVSALAASAPKPSISGFSPLTVAPLASLTISGKSFTGAKTVTIGGKLTTFRVVAATRVIATVPRAATSGKIVVTTAAGSATSSRRVTVLALAPIPPLGGNLASGKSLFNSDCAACHTLAAAGAHGTLGPNLNGTSLSEPVLIKAIVNGGSTVMSAAEAGQYSTTMVAFGQTLSTAQIDDIAAFVYASTHE